MLRAIAGALVTVLFLMAGSAVCAAQPARIEIVRDTAPAEPIGAAFAANDVRRAIDLGAKAADVVRFAQAHGRYLDHDVGASQVFVAADGSILDVRPLRPLPPLPAASASGEGAGQRTAPLYQANPFSLPPGTAIVLSPAGTGEPERYFAGKSPFPGP